MPLGFVLHSKSSKQIQSVYHMSSYLVEGKRAYAVRSQVHSVQHGHLDHPIGLCASTGPILVTFHLHRDAQPSLFIYKQ